MFITPEMFRAQEYENEGKPLTPFSIENVTLKLYQNCDFLMDSSHF